MADCFFDDSDLDEAEARQEVSASPKPLPAWLASIQAPDVEDKDDAQPEVRQSRYWWEEGYEAPDETAKSKEKKRVWNRKTMCYEDIGVPASRSPSVSSRASSRAPSSQEGVLPGTNCEVERLADVLSRIDADIVSDELPQNYQARPVPKRAWNPETAAFEVVHEGAIVAASSSSGRGWMPRKEPAAPLPIEDIMQSLDKEEKQPPLSTEKTTTLAVSASSSVKEGIVPFSSSTEMPSWSKWPGGFSKEAGPVEDLMERYGFDEETFTPALYDLQVPDHVQRAKRVEELRRKKRDNAIAEAIAENPELEEYFRPKDENTSERQKDHEQTQRPRLGKWTQGAPEGKRTTVAQDQGEAPLSGGPTKRERLPGMAKPKRSSDAASSSSKPVREVSLSSSSAAPAWAGFSLLPGMPLPFERAASSFTPIQEKLPSTSVAAVPATAAQVAPEGSSSATSGSEVARPTTLAEKLRNHRRQGKEDKDDDELEEAFQNIGGQRSFQPMRVPAKHLPKSFAKAPGADRKSVV